MHAELTHGGRQLLAADLNCPESRARVVACVVALCRWCAGAVHHLGIDPCAVGTLTGCTGL